MKDIRIIFMGTPDFAVASLKAILDQNYEIVAVITAPDRPAGRGRKLQASAVKLFAVTRDIPVLQPTNLKDPNFITELKQLNATLYIVVAFRMLPKLVWSLPELGTFNLHASLLPEYRGAAPINWAIINGEQKTGVSTFFIDEKIDTGKIILQKETTINENENAGQLHDRLMTIGADAVIETIQQIKRGEVQPKKQESPEPLKTAYKLHKENTKINWNLSIETIYNFIRGLSPYPTAWSFFYNNSQKETIKIFSASKEIEAHSHTTGKIIIQDSAIKVAVENGYLHLHEIQLPGKKRLDAAALLNGYTFFKDAQMC